MLSMKLLEHSKALGHWDLLMNLLLICVPTLFRFSGKMNFLKKAMDKTKSKLEGRTRASFKSNAFEGSIAANESFLHGHLIIDIIAAKELPDMESWIAKLVRSIASNISVGCWFCAFYCRCEDARFESSRLDWTGLVKMIEWWLFAGQASLYRRNKVIKMVINRGELVNREVIKVIN